MRLFDVSVPTMLVVVDGRSAHWGAINWKRDAVEPITSIESQGIRPSWALSIIIIAPAAKPPAPLVRDGPRKRI